MNSLALDGKGHIEVEIEGQQFILRPTIVGFDTYANACREIAHRIIKKEESDIDGAIKVFIENLDNMLGEGSVEKIFSQNKVPINVVDLFRVFVFITNEIINFINIDVSSIVENIGSDD